MSPHYRRAVASLVALAGLAALAAVARAEASPRIGVIVAISVNTTAEEANEVATGLAAALQSELIVDVISGDEVARRLPDGGLSDVCVLDPACIRTAGDRLGTDQLLILAIVKVGTRLQVDPTVVDVQTGAAVSRPAIQLETGDRAGWALRFRQATREILPDAAVRAAQAADDGQDSAAGLLPDDEPGKPAAAPAPVVTPARDRHLTPASWIAGGIGVACLTGGLVFALKARSGYHDLDDRGCASIACDPADIDRVDRQALYADLLVGAGILASATAGVLFLRSGRAESRSVQIITTPSAVQVSVGGRF